MTGLCCVQGLLVLASLSSRILNGSCLAALIIFMLCYSEEETDTKYLWSLCTECYYTVNVCA